MTFGRVNPHFRLEDQGITGLGDVHYNLIEPALIEAALKRGEGTLGQGRDVSCQHRKVHRTLPQGQARGEIRHDARHDLVGQQRRDDPRGVRRALRRHDATT